MKPQFDEISKTWFVIENGGEWVTVPAPVSAPWYDEVERMHFKLLDGELASCREDGTGGYKLRAYPEWYDRKTGDGLRIKWTSDADPVNCGFNVDAIMLRHGRETCQPTPSNAAVDIA